MTLQVEVFVGGWEAAQPFEQLHKQAEREAREKLQRHFGEASNVKISTEPAVMHVITREEK